MSSMRARIVVLSLLISATGCLHAQTSSSPGARIVPDSHNCYPYNGKWNDRIERALAHGTPVAIEQDLYWYIDPVSGRSRSVLAHTAPLTGKEPGMEEYFFARVRPIVEEALRHPDPSKWPLITLNLDIKTEEPEHLKAIWAELSRHRAWLTTAINTADPSRVEALHLAPILVLAGTSDAVEQVFHKDVPIGSELLVFGAVHTNSIDPSTPPNQLETEPASNYRRWWNVSWTTVENGGAPKAQTWAPALQTRVRQMVSHAHTNGLWIRFYTLDGATESEQAANGWFRTYNFPSMAAAKQRWDSLIAAGADYIASDQYELLAKEIDQDHSQNDHVEAIMKSKK